MLYVPEEQTAALVDDDLALEAARAAFAATVDAALLPSLIAHGSDPRNRFTLKPSVSADHAAIKIGTFWPDNPSTHGVPRHHSTLLLLDQRTGRLAAVLEAGAANAYRTAAADALAVDVLARADASTLAVFGTGNQASHDVRAVSRIRPITEVLVVGRDQDHTRQLVSHLLREGHRARAAGTQEACDRADVIITVTTARAEDPPLFEAGQVRPGTRISCMGADGPGKRELPTHIFASARVFCDVPEQARRMGECQHAPTGTVLTPLGAVLTGRADGRRSADDITVFDSSGIGLQDLYLALALLNRMDVTL